MEIKRNSLSCFFRLISLLVIHALHFQKNSRVLELQHWRNNSVVCNLFLTYMILMRTSLFAHPNRIRIDRLSWWDNVIEQVKIYLNAHFWRPLFHYYTMFKVEPFFFYEIVCLIYNCLETLSIEKKSWTGPQIGFRKYLLVLEVNGFQGW